MTAAREDLRRLYRHLPDSPHGDGKTIGYPYVQSPVTAFICDAFNYAVRSFLAENKTAPGQLICYP